ncbi:hypothetical protein OF83DRAFT_1180779 [Amylostereum chailletii]|nr:hypothetical protein OF83DRAFT_1180779 [Amylostereum chailletii]
MKVITTFHTSSSVVASVAGHLTNDSSLRHLIVGYSDRLVVYSAQPDGLRQECVTEIWGRLMSLKILPRESKPDRLLLLTDHPEPQLIVLSYDPGANTLDRDLHLNLTERNARVSEFFHDVAVSPLGDIAVVSCYSGKLRAVRLVGKSNANELDQTIPEFNLISLAFVSTDEDEDTYALAFLYLDHQNKRQLISPSRLPRSPLQTRYRS